MIVAAWQSKSLSRLWRGCVRMLARWSGVQAPASLDPAPATGDGPLARRSPGRHANPSGAEKCLELEHGRSVHPHHRLATPQ